MDPAPVLLFWSSGKDSAWALSRLRQAGYSVGALLTTCSEEGRVPFHEIPIEWVELQAKAIGIPLWVVPLPFPTSNSCYEEVILRQLQHARQKGFRFVAYGDLYLDDIRAYRERLTEKAGLSPLFPVWTGSPEASHSVASAILQAGIRAYLTWADPHLFPTFRFGTPYTERWIKSLPASVDPCGERGEFHTFCSYSPDFQYEVGPQIGFSPDSEE
ncbi:MAG: ATP-binding protein [Bacteroidia bacterium]|nr:ATP-binding protein [Bacteroidia bacterium]MDW8014943.1 ATP-binding protein [Bacteroidia bacterium]